MTKESIWTAAAVACGLLAGVVLIPYAAEGPYRRNATRHAESYVAGHRRLSGGFAACSGRASRPGYVTCAITLQSGPREVIECPANWLPDDAATCMATEPAGR